MASLACENYRSEAVPLQFAFRSKSSRTRRRLSQDCGSEPGVKISHLQRIPFTDQQDAIYRQNVDAVCSVVLLQVPGSSTHTVEKVSWTWQTIARKTAVLRTRIRKAANGSCYQVVQTTANPIEHVPIRRRARDGALLEVVFEGEMTSVTLHIHRALVDATSLALLQKDFALCFNGFVTEPRQSMAAYMNHLSMKQVDSAIHFWQRAYTDMNATSLMSSLALSHQSPRLEATVTAEASVFEEMCDFVTKFDLRFDDLLHAALAVVINRHANGQHQNACFAISGRDMSFFKNESAIGLIDRTFPLALAVPRDIHVVPWLEEVRNASTTASCNAFIGYQRIMTIAGIEQPQVKLCVGFLENTRDCMTADDNFAYVINASITTHLRLSVRYNASESGSDATAMLRHLLTVLEAMMSDPWARVGDIGLVSAAEEEFLLQIGRAAFEPQEGLLHNLVERQALRTPEANALQYEGDDALSYAALNNKANRLARRTSIYKGSIIPVMMHTTVNFVVALLAILKSGAAYVILDPSAPAERNRSIVAAVGASIVIVDSQTAGLVEAEIEKNVEVLLEASVDEVEADLGLEIDPSETAYIILTSGSTGKPKAVVLPHKAAYNGLIAFPKVAGRRQLLFFNPVFSAAQRSIWAPLCTGGCLCLASKENLTIRTADMIRAMKIDSIEMTSSTASLISPESVPSLQRLALGGEMPSPTLIKLWSPHVELLSSYGLSECTQLNVRRRLESQAHTRMLGRAFDSTTTYILQSGKPSLSPLLGPGELCFGGPQVARGYLNDPEETSRRFVPNPFGCGKLYRTGDLAVRHADGTIELLGRIDMQTKINGQKVDPAEVNTIIQAHELVEQSAVVAASVGKRIALAAMVVYYPGAQWDNVVRGLKAALSHRLPSYMIPSFWISAAALPLNANQKVDLRAVRRHVENLAEAEQLVAREDQDAAGLQNWTDRELIVRTLWSEFLDIHESNLHLSNSFTDLGGTSLEAVQIASKLSNEYALSLRVEHMILCGSLREAASHISTEQSARSTDVSLSEALTMMPAIPQPKTIGFDDDEVEDVFPVTPFQEGVITNALMGKDDFIYQRAYSFDGFDAESVRASWQLLMQSEPLLRTTFAAHDTTFVQVVRKSIELPWAVYDMPLNKFLQQRPPSMSLGGSWWKATVLSGRTLVVTVHHALFDYWSNGFLAQDISALLRNEMPISRTPFKKYVEYVQAQEQTSMHDFWKRYLKECPTARLGSGLAAEHVASAGFGIDLKAAASKIKVTPSVLLYTAWAVTLAHNFSTKDVIFGITLSGRDAPVTGVLEMNGPTLMTVPFRVNLNDEHSLAVTALQVQATLWEVSRYAALGMRKIFKAANLPKDCFDSGVNFLFKPSKSTPADGLVLLPQAKLERNDSVKLELKGDTMAAVTLSSTLHVAEAQRLVDTVSKILECFGNHDQSINTCIPSPHSIPEKTVEDDMADVPSSASATSSEDNEEHDGSSPGFSSTSSDDGDSFFEAQQPVISEATFTPCNLARSLPACSNFTLAYGSVQAEIQRMAAMRPSHIAVQEASGRSITYAGMMIRANQLGNLLRSQGVRAENVVPIMLEKSIETVIAMLGVMLSGGAFVTLDGKHPGERNRGIIEDVRTRIAITDKANSQFFAGMRYEVIPIDQLLWHTLPVQRCWAPEVTLDSLAYIIYTSGSTGKPKGTLLTNVGLAAATQALVETTGVTPSWRCLWALNYIFDGSFHGLFSVLSVGATICLAPQDVVIANMTSLINSMNVTETNITPTMVGLLTPEQVPSLKTLLIGGEPVPPFIVDTWSKALTVYSAYGPTEATIAVTALEVTPGHNLRNIGRAFKTVDAMILDQETTAEIAQGEVGELCIAGPQLARGYLNRPEATAKAFQVRSDGTRMYRTGDLARWLPNGEIELFGRIDDQIKLNGYRIELGEIESVIKQTSDFDQCVVIVATIMNKKQLVAFCLDPREGQESENMFLPPKLSPNWKVVVDNLQTLAGYMIPTVWFAVSRMPLSASGKANKKELLAYVEGMDESLLKEYLGEAEILEIAEGPERALQSLWSSTLGVSVDVIHANSTFHGMGGDSISAISLTSAARREGYQITVAEILSNPTLREQTRFLEKLSESNVMLDDTTVTTRYAPPPAAYDRLANLNIHREDIEDIHPCGPGQIEFLTQGNKPEQFWQLHTVRTLPVDFDFERWIYLTTKLTIQNQILRAFYLLLEDDDPSSALQVVLKHPVLDLTYRTYRSADERQQIIDADWERRFDVGKPFVRYTMLQNAENNTRDLIIKLDHASYDGSLLYIFDDQFVALDQGIPPPRQSLFKDFIGYVSTVPKQSQLSYWRRILNGHTTSFLASLEQPKICDGVTATVSADLGLDSFAESCGVTAPIVFQTAYTFLLAHLSGTHDVVYDNLISGRNVPINDPHLINGTCANFLPFRGQLMGDMTVKSILSRTQADFWQSSENGFVSMSDINQAIGRDCSARSKCLFCFQPFEPSADDNNEMRWIVMKKNKNRMYFNYAIQLEIRKAPMRAGYIVQFTFDERAMSKDDANVAVEWYRDCLRQLVQAPEALVKTLGV